MENVIVCPKFLGCTVHSRAQCVDCDIDTPLDSEKPAKFDMFPPFRAEVVVGGFQIPSLVHWKFLVAGPGGHEPLTSNHRAGIKKTAES